MARIIITADSGCDLSKETVERLGVRLVPFRFSIAGKQYVDGDLSTDEMLRLCNEYRTTPKTSACSPYDYMQAFASLHNTKPDANILHLGWSAATTSSFDSAVIAAETVEGVACVDTKSACVPYGVIVESSAQFVASNPDATLQDAISYAREISERMRIGFVPSDLDFLHKSGRLTGIESIAAHVLKIKPVVELIEGRMKVTQKLRGYQKAVCMSFLRDFLVREPIEGERIILLYTPGLSLDVRNAIEECASDLGIRDFYWAKTGCVTAAHVGSNAFGCAYLAKA